MDVMFHFYLSEKDVPLSNVLSDLGYSICQSTVNVCVCRHHSPVCHCPRKITRFDTLECLGENKERKDMGKENIYNGMSITISISQFILTVVCH